MDVDYKTRSFYPVTSLSKHLKGRMAYYADYHFKEAIFLSLNGEELVLEERYEIILILVLINVNWKFKKIIHLHGLANQLPNAFIDAKKVTKSYSLT